MTIGTAIVIIAAVAGFFATTWVSPVDVAPAFIGLIAERPVSRRGRMTIPLLVLVGASQDRRPGRHTPAPVRCYTPFTGALFFAQSHPHTLPTDSAYERGVFRPCPQVAETLGERRDIGVAQRCPDCGGAGYDEHGQRCRTCGASGQVDGDDDEPVPPPLDVGEGLWECAPRAPSWAPATSGYRPWGAGA